MNVTNFFKYERSISIPSLEVANRMADVLEVSLDRLDQAETIDDNDLLTLFSKAQKISDKQKGTVKDFLSAFVLKADLTQKLSHKKTSHKSM